MRPPFSRVTYTQEHNIVFSSYAKYRRNDLFVGCQCRDDGTVFSKAFVDEIAIELRLCLIVIVHAVSNIQNMKACCDEVRYGIGRFAEKRPNRFSHKEF
jgi:hypothetical protein